MTTDPVGPFHVAAGIHIGAMGDLPTFSNIQSILTVAVRPGLVPPKIRHRHEPLEDEDGQALKAGVDWVLDQVHSDRPVLIRSERGLQRPGLVAGLVILEMGGRYEDAVTCVRRANPLALTDSRCLDALAQSSPSPAG